MDIKSLLAEKVSNALNEKDIKSARNIEVRQVNKPQFGDYQINSVMAIAKGNMVPTMELVQYISDWLSEKSVMV